MVPKKTQSLLVIACLLVVATPLFSQTIPKITPELESTLLAVLRSDASFQEKAGACRQLAVAGSAKAIPDLVDLLADKKLSHMARYALETMPGSAVGKTLRQALDRLQGKPLVGVIGSLGVRRDTQAVESLIELVHHKDSEVSQAALRALGSIGNDQAAAALQTALAHAPATKQLGLYESLLRCAETQVAMGNRKAALGIYDSLHKAKTPFQVRSAALRSIIILQGSESPSLLRRSLRSENYLIVSAAVQAALELPSRNITQILIEAIPEQSLDAQILLVATIGNRADESALSTLHGLAQQGKTPVCLASIKALSQIGHRSTTPVLVTLSQNSNPEIAQAATRSLAAFPAHASPAVLKMFKSNQVSQRLTALELIGLRRMTTSLPALVKAATDTNPDIRVKALKTIGELGSLAELPDLLALLPQITDTKHLDAMRQALTDISARANDAEACVTQLTNALSQSDVAQKVALIRVLSSIQGATALKVVRDAVDDPNPEIHLGAIRALGTWNNADASPVLLTLVRTSKNTRDRTLCLRGYLRIAERGGLPTNQRLAMCQEIKPLLKQAAEKQQWLGVLGRIDSPKALVQIMPSFNDPSVKESACTVSITLIERVAKKNPRLKENRTVKKALQKIVDVSAKTDLKTRAQRLLDSI